MSVSKSLTHSDKISRDKSKQEAIEYLNKWGESFWKETDYRVKEITQTLEQNLGASVEGSLSGSIPALGSAGLALNADTARKLTEESKAEVVSHGQQVVDGIQVRVLSEIIDLLDTEILDDRQKMYLITIDRLDENWVNDDLRYHLIRALIETVRVFNNQISNVKIIMALREDLLDRVFRHIRSPGYQEEKYKSLYLVLVWKESELHKLLNKRVDQLVKEQYTSYSATLSDILPKRVYGKDSGVKFLLGRTLLRPRDAIAFLNECIRSAEDKAKITQTMLLDAEARYSDNRLRALADEWSADYPNLIELSFFLKEYPKTFRIDQIVDKIERCMLNFLISFENSPSQKRDGIYYLVEEKFYNDDTETFIHDMFKILYKTGVVGIKHESYEHTSWSFLGQKMDGSDIGPKALFHIHPAFWRVLGVNPK